MKTKICDHKKVSICQVWEKQVKTQEPIDKCAMGINGDSQCSINPHGN